MLPAPRCWRMSYAPRSANNGTWSLGPEVTNQKEPAPTGSLAWSGRSDATQYSLGANMYTHDHEAGDSREVTDGTGTVIAERRGANPHKDGEYALNGQVSFPAGGGALTFTGQAAFAEHEEAWSLRTTTPDDELIESEHAPYQEDTLSGEAGVNWQRPVGPWDMELVALLTRKNYGSDVTYTHFDATDTQDLQSVQTVDQDSGESILRGTFTRALGRGQLETGGEIAINTLDGTSDLTEDVGAGPVPIDLPNADLSVEENRAEGFVSYATPLDDNWSFDARLAAETSRLSFTGDTEQSVSLTYVKPRVQFTRKFGEHQLQMRVFRDVGQLDFTDFVSTAELADEVIDGGNPDLRPQTAWAVELDTDLRFSGDTALRVRLFRHFLDDVIDFVAVGPPEAQFDAPGNIGEGTLTGIQVSLRVPLQPVLPGATFNVNTTLSDSEVTDPTTGERRQISDFIENTITAELRQDLSAARFSWGLVFTGYSPETDYQLREIDSFRQLRRLDAWIETTAFEAFKIRLTANSITGDTERRDRRFYEPDRTGVLFARELSNLPAGHLVAAHGIRQLLRYPRLTNPQAPTRTRYIVVMFMVLLAMVTYLDRACIGAMAPQIAAEFALDEGQMSWVFFAFIISYAIFEIPTARWADRRGAKAVLTRIVSWWSIFTIATAGAFNYVSLLVARLLFGAGEAGAWPCVARVMSRWIPKRSRGTAKGIFFAGAYASATLTTLIVTPLLSYVSWRTILVVFGCVGFVWVIAWQRWFRDEPTEHPAANEAERALILADRPPEVPQPRGWAFWSNLLRQRNVRLLCIAYMPNCATFYFCITWLPTYLMKQHGFEKAELGMVAALPLLLSTGTQFLGGWFSDLIARRYGLTGGPARPRDRGLHAGGGFHHRRESCRSSRYSPR